MDSCVCDYIIDRFESTMDGRILLHYRDADRELELPEGSTFNLIEKVANRLKVYCKDKGANIVTLTTKP